MRQPAWTAAAVACLAIGTGANTAVFTLINGVLLRPLPFVEPDEIVMIAIQSGDRGQPGPVSLAQFRDLPESAETFEHLAARTFLPVAVGFGDSLRMTQAELVTGEYFELLGVKALHGRLLTKEDDRPGGPDQAVVSEKLWRTRFGSDPSIVGDTIRVNGRLLTVCGIAPVDFFGAMRLIAADIWLPASSFGAFASPGNPGEADSRPVFGLIGRLHSGESPERATARFEGILVNQWVERSDVEPAPKVLMNEATGFGVPPVVRKAVVGGAALLFALMGLVVAVAVANVAGLMLARSTSRERETAVRLALGAGRFHVIRPVLLEATILALVGSAVGSVLAFALPTLLSGLGPSLPEHLSFAVDLRPDWRTWAYSIASALLVAALFAVAPARLMSRTKSNLALRQSAGTTQSRTTSQTLNAFVAAQVAVSTVLLMLAILLGRSYLNIQAVDPGVDTRNVIAVSLDWNQTGRRDTEGRLFYDQLLAQASSLPGVRRAALTRSPPLSPAADSAAIVVEAAEAFRAGRGVVTAEYFEVAGIPLLVGRRFQSEDDGSHAVAIVNETMARLLEPSASALGRTFQVGSGAGPRLEVVGIVRDSKYRSLAEAPKALYYEPFAQAYSAQMSLVVRTQSDPHSLVEPIQDAIRTINPDLAATAVRTLEEQHDESVAPSRQRAMILGGTCATGLLMSAFGLFGVISYGARQRVRELGIRMAIGARPAMIALMIVLQCYRLAATGFAIGIVFSILAGRVLAGTLFGVSEYDPVSIALVIVVLVAVATASSWLPARWAMKLDPIACIREP